MKQIVILLLLANVASAQISVIVLGDSVEITGTPDSGAIDYQLNFQNANNLNESVWYWSDSGEGKFTLPYCNTRISRTAFYSDFATSESNEVTVTRSNVQINVSAMPNRTALIEVSGGSYEVKFRHIAYGGWYPFFSNGVQHYPAGQFSGSTTAFIPYRISGAQIAQIKVNAGVCSQTVAKIFYLN